MQQTYLRLNNIPPLQNRLHNLILIARPKLILQLTLGCTIQNPLSTLPKKPQPLAINPSTQPNQPISSHPNPNLPNSWYNLLMCNKHLKPTHNLRKRNTLVLLPVLHGLGGFDEDDVVVFLAFDVDFDLGGVAAHGGRGLGGRSEVLGLVKRWLKCLECGMSKAVWVTKELQSCRR